MTEVPRPMPALPIVWPDTTGMRGVEAAHGEWRSIVDDYEANPGNPYLAWLYLGHHPMFWEITHINIAKEPEEGPGSYLPVPTLDFSNAWSRRQCIEMGMGQYDDGELFVWMEVRPTHWPTDPDGVERATFEDATFEKLVLKAAELIHSVYGNDRETVFADDDSRWYG